MKVVFGNAEQSLVFFLPSFSLFFLLFTLFFLFFFAFLLPFFLKLYPNGGDAVHLRVKVVLGNAEQSLVWWRKATAFNFSSWTTYVFASLNLEVQTQNFQKICKILDSSVWCMIEISSNELESLGCIFGLFQCPFVLFGNIFIIGKMMTALLGFSSDVEVKGNELITELTWWPPWTVLESFHRFEIIKKEKLFIKLTT